MSTLKGLQCGMPRPIVPCMAQSLAKILVHTVFSTKERRPFLKNRDVRIELHAYVGGILGNLDCQPIIVGGVEDHVHLLCALSRTQTAAGVVKEVKRGSTLWLKAQWTELAEFSWQSGYGMFSIGASQAPVVKRYIASQEMHHQTISFQDEFLTLLRRYDMDFDQRYVWD
jgi:REP element-mobilizing transposase RayT